MRKELIERLRDATEGPRMLMGEAADMLEADGKLQSNPDMVAFVDAAMVEMKNITPPLRRSECERLIRAALYAQQAVPQEPPAFTTGHCKEHNQPGGCQLHNVQCGYPACDRKAAPQQRAPLTNEEITKAWESVKGTAFGYAPFARAIERKVRGEA